MQVEGSSQECCKFKKEWPEKPADSSLCSRTYKPASEKSGAKEKETTW